MYTATVLTPANIQTGKGGIIRLALSRHSDRVAFSHYQLVYVSDPNLATGDSVLAKHLSTVSQVVVEFEDIVASNDSPRGAWTNIFASSERISVLIKDDRIQDVARLVFEKTGRIVAAQIGRVIEAAATFKLDSSSAAHGPWCRMS
jgi:hypothetical protein